MEGILFIGIPASGKSTFYKERFFHTHLRISLDMLNTRNKENQLLDKCLELRQRVVIDNTNPKKEERKKYIEKFKENNYKVIGYFFRTDPEAAVERNKGRPDEISETGIWIKHKQLEMPEWEEGFDELYEVKIADGEFEVEEWK